LNSNRSKGGHNEEAQANLLQAILQSFWDVAWFPDENQYKERQKKSI